MSGWALGFAIGAVVVAVVVVLLLLMIRGARRVATRAESILAGLQQARAATAPLWDLPATRATAGRIYTAARRSSRLLGEGGGR